jgi:hypothetical protein
MPIFIATENEAVTLGSTLICPNCKCNNLHQKRLDAEDDPHPVDLLRIRFWCEQCPSEPILCIQQYKGTTYIGWHSMRVIL